MKDFFSEPRSQFLSTTTLHLELAVDTHSGDGDSVDHNICAYILAYFNFITNKFKFKAYFTYCRRSRGTKWRSVYIPHFDMT